jgi:transcriptional regulator with XRE-family HTH domain
MSIKELRLRRVHAEIPATLLAAKAKLNRSRLSNLERGYTEPTDAELHRLTEALDLLIRAKSAVNDVATAVGWPWGTRHDR